MNGFLNCLKSALAATLIVVQVLAPFVHAHAGEAGQTGFHLHLANVGDDSRLSQTLTDDKAQGNEVTIASSLPRGQKDASPVLYLADTAPPGKFLSIEPAPSAPAILERLTTHRRSVAGIFNTEGPPPPKHAPPTISS